MQALLSIYENAQTIPFAAFQKQISILVQDRKVAEQILELRETRKADKLSALDFKFNSQEEKILQQALLQMDATTSNLALEYILNPQYSDKEFIVRILPMLQYSAANPELSMSFWNNPVIRDGLLSLPASCFAGKIYLEADHLLAIKNFLDRFIDVRENESEYSKLFNQFVRGAEAQPEHRKRLLSQYEEIIERADMPKVELLKNMAELGEHLKAPEYLNVLKRFIEKMKKEYEAPRMPVKELDAVWNNMGNSRQPIAKLLPLIEQVLATEGKEYISRLNAIFKLEPDLIISSQQFLTAFFPKTRNTRKAVKITEYEKALEGLQDLFSNERHKYDNAMQIFAPYLLSDEFKYASELDGIKILLGKFPAETLKKRLKAYSNKDIHYLLSQLHHFPENAEDWLTLAPAFVHYLDSDSYANFSSREQAISTAGIRHLLEAGIVEKDKVSSDVLKSLNVSEMQQLLYFSKNYPQHAHNLLAMKPLITYISQLRDNGEQERTFQLIVALLENIESTKTPLRAVRGAFTKKPSILEKDTLPLLLELFENNKGHETDILLSSLAGLGPLSKAQYSVINWFYENKDMATELFRKEFMLYPQKERLALMDLLKNDSFVSRLPTFGFPQGKAHAIFQAGLDAYKTHISGVLEQSKSNGQPRDLSSDQQKEVLAVMGELETIGTTPTKFVPKQEANTKQNLDKAIKAQIQAYEKLWIKDTQRFNDLKTSIAELRRLAADKGKNYRELTEKVRDIKIGLMRQDSYQASLQLLPTFHLSGQSRLYKTFNDIEDLILKSWTYTANQDVAVSKDFTVTFDETRTEYAIAFKEALDSWNTINNLKFSLFKNSCVEKMHQVLQHMGHDEIVQYLRANPNEVKNLPGTLRAIAKEVLAHSLDDNMPHLNMGAGL